MMLFPKLYQIELSQVYFDGILDECTTATPRYHWNGYKHYKWLWLNFKKAFRDFNIDNNGIRFTKNIKGGIDIKINYEWRQ